MNDERGWRGIDDMRAIWGWRPSPAEVERRRVLGLLADALAEMEICERQEVRAETATRSTTGRGQHARK
jgi:hypothetical protein